MTKTISQNSTIFIPGKGDGRTPVSVLVFYPGIPVGGKIGKYYMPPLIQEAVPEWFDKYVIVIPNTHTSNWKSVQQEYDSALDEAGLTEANLTIGCFSGAGNGNASIQQNLASLKVLNLLLMDPTSTGRIVKNVEVLKSVGTNCYLAYNPNNWRSGYPALAAGFERLAQAVGKNAINTKSKVYDHQKIPGFLLKTWKRDLELTLIEYGKGQFSNNVLAMSNTKNNRHDMNLNECGCGCGGNSNSCSKKKFELNYMFMGNLETIKRMIDELLHMDPSQVDRILKDGHDWAVDHVASSVDDIQEVYNFLKTRIGSERHNPFAEKEIFVKTFESFVTETKKIDQDKDGDNDFIDAKIAQYIAGGMTKAEAIKKAKSFKSK